jgi:hypothetical protein
MIRMGTEMRFTKWGGRRHWHYTMEELGEDEFGWWYAGRQSITIQRGFEPPIPQPHDFVTLVPRAGLWIASWNDPARTETVIYVDVTTRPIRSGRSIHAVDLDLDVIRRRDGVVEVLDEDEFAEHQVRHAYPKELIAQALDTTAELVDLVSAHAEPFGAAGADRVAQVTAHTSG